DLLSTNGQLIDHTSYAVDFARDFHGTIAAGTGLDRPLQRDDVIGRVDVDVAAFQQVIPDHARLDLRGDPRVGDHFPGLAEAFLGLVTGFDRGVLGFLAGRGHGVASLLSDALPGFPIERD